MKKVSLLVLTFISFLFVGMMMPNTYADEGEIQITLNAVAENEDPNFAGKGEIFPMSFSVPFGNIVDLNLSGILSNEDNSVVLVHDNMIVPNDTEFMMSNSTNISVIIKETEGETTDYVAIFVDTNGELLDVVYNPVDEPTTLAEPSKPGYTFIGFDTTIITEDTVFVAEYQVDNVTPITVTVNDGNMDLIAPKFNDVVTVTTDLEGFTHWEDEFGFVVSYEPTFKFTALNNITLSAKTGGTEAPNLYLRDVTGIRTSGDSFLAKLHLPSDYELVEWGFVGSNTNLEGQYEPELGDNDVESNPSKTLNPATNEFLTTITGDGFAYTRAYAIVYNTTTEQFEIIYSLVRNKVVLTIKHSANWNYTDGHSEPHHGLFVKGIFDRGTWNSVGYEMTYETEIEERHIFSVDLPPLIWIGNESFKVMFKINNIVVFSPSDRWFGSVTYKPASYWLDHYNHTISGENENYYEYWYNTHYSPQIVATITFDD